MSGKMVTKRAKATPRRAKGESIQDESWAHSFVTDVNAKLKDVSDRTIRIEERTNKIDDIDKSVSGLTLKAGFILSLFFVVLSIIVRFVFPATP